MRLCMACVCASHASMYGVCLCIACVYVWCVSVHHMRLCMACVCASHASMYGVCLPETCAPRSSAYTDARTHTHTHTHTHTGLALVGRGLVWVQENERFGLLTSFGVHIGLGVFPCARARTHALFRTRLAGCVLCIDNVNDKVNFQVCVCLFLSCKHVYTSIYLPTPIYPHSSRSLARMSVCVRAHAHSRAHTHSL